jgi:Tol biopolymer transport system component
MRNIQAAYSPDGQYLVFSSCSSTNLLKGALGDCALYRIRADGSGKAVKLVGGKGQDWHIANWRR